MKIYFFLIPVIICFNIKGQHYPTTKFWAGISAKKKISKKIGTSYYVSLRGMSTYNYSIFGQTSLDYKISKISRFKIKYRYTWKNVEGLSYEHRAALDFTTKYKLSKNSKINYRARIQNELQNIREYNPNPLSSIFRNKIIFEREISKKINVFSGYELFSNIIEQKINDGYRFYIGTSLDIGRKKRLDIAYIYNQKISNLENLNYSNIVSIKYNFSI